jgi:cell division septum initiation protein DivIVA
VNPDTLPPPAAFALTVRGCDREQVDEHLAELNEEIRLLTLDRDAAVAEAEQLARCLEDARAEVSGLRAHLDRVIRTPADPAILGDRLRRILELGHSEADTAVRAAQRRAATIIEQAADTRRHTLARLREIDDFLAQAEDILAEEPPIGGQGTGLVAA